MDQWTAVSDEVALEGLEGITLPSLWIRLEDRHPKFPLKLDDSTKELIWRFLISNTDLKFYQLPRERGDVKLFDRFKDIDPDTGIGKPQPFNEKEIYPVSIILENKDGIQGSCSVFKERVHITKHVRSGSLTPLVTLEEALERYGRKLVVVASNSVRFRALIGSSSDPDVKLSDDSYCLLEKVGRARWQGELQSELHRCSFKTDARKLHYMRKSLVRNGLITMQSHVTRAKSGQQQQHSILLLLNRFHINRRSKCDMLMEQMSDLLEKLPGQFATLVAIKQHLNVTERAFKRVYQCMRASKLVEVFQFPLEDIDPSAKPCLTKKGNKVLVRCVKLLKPYSKKGAPDDEDDDDEDEEDDSGTRKKGFLPYGRIMEKDVLSQAYHIVLSCGTKGMPKTGIGHRLNIGKLESRMICRRLEKDGMLKGFMEDEGRQRITKYVGHKCVGDQVQLFEKEQEREKLLFSAAPQTSCAAAAGSKVPPPSGSTGKGNNNSKKKKKNQKACGGGDEDAKGPEQTCGDEEVADEGLDGGGGKARGKSKRGRRSKGKKSKFTDKQMQLDLPKIQPPPAECETPTTSDSKTSPTPDVLITEQAATEEEEQSNVTSVPPEDETEASSNKPDEITIMDFPEEAPSKRRSQQCNQKTHETYRLLKRKNQIVEAVRNFRVIEGLLPLQKMINDEEKLEGVNSKCCKKTILRLIQTLSREGLLKFYTTTIIQDGITKKVQMVVHPSIQPTDPLVQRVLDQVRFKISSCYSTIRQQEEKAREQENQPDSTANRSKEQKSKANKIKDDFNPTTVRGLGKSLGFQPKMHRLRVVHNFLWYVIYGHPLQQNSADSQPTDETSVNTHSSDADPNHPDHDKQDLKDTQNSTIIDETTQSSDTADSATSKLDSVSGDEEEEQNKSESKLGHSNLKAYAEEVTWKKFIPPVRVHKEFGTGWAMVGDLLLCLPISVFIQVIQINYNVDGLEEYLNDPVKQHLLVRALPSKMRRQLFYRRKYLFSFHENLQKLVYMGLLQLGPSEKFKEKDQVFLYLKRNATIVDTTSAEPHYWLITESPDKPFEKRKYTFNTYEDVENYWFDLMCVCLNTPLGVIRTRKNVSEDDSSQSFVHERYVFLGLAYLLKGSLEVHDDGSIPGDGKGAGGLDSEFFAHLKRNWLWTNHLLAVKTSPAVFEERENKIRLKSLLSNNALRFAFKAGETTKPRGLTTKVPLMEYVEVGVEPATRNQQVVGGKRQKRKRTKKEVVKAPRKKKKEPKKRTPAHDEADHRALKLMTRQRVYWSVQEDSLMMLCSVASHLLNSKLKRPYVPYCGVRDLLHSEFEMSMDKTSVAVARRTRYILKNPQTLLNYRICLAEVYQDKPLMKLLEEKKPADPDKLEDCAAAFLEYARLLRQKFSSSTSPLDVVTPDTKQDLFSRFKVSAIDSTKEVLGRDIVTCTDDIHTIVLHNLIQSTLAMTNCQMKSSRSFQTFHIYSKYNQELLCQVFLQCRKSGLVNRRRVNQPFGPKKNRALPILPMSYQLSQSYYRCFSWRFPHSLCTDSFRFMRTLVNNGTGDDRPVTLFYHEPENRLQNGEQVSERQKESKRKEKQSEVSAENTTVSEPEVQPMEVNTESTKEGENEHRPEEAEETLMEIGEAHEEKTPENNLAAGSGEEPPGRERTDNQLPEDTPPAEAAAPDAAPGVPEEAPDVSDMLLFPLDSPGGACVTYLSLISLGLLNFYISIPRQMVMVDSSLVDNDVVKSMSVLEEEDDNDDDDGEECEGKKKLEVKAHQASHTKYLMMRGFCCPGIVKGHNLNTSDNIVVESCVMRLQLRNTPAHHIFSVENGPPLDLLKCSPSPVPSILTSTVSLSPLSSSLSHSGEECDRSLIEQRGYTPQDLEACADLRRSLNEAGEKGLDDLDLYQAHSHQAQPQSGRTRSLKQYIQDLHEEGQVVKVGSQGVRYVLLEHAEPWLLTVNSKQWSQTQVTPDRLRFFNNPLMRKRFRRESKEETEEPPCKKAALDKQESREDGEDREGSDMTREKLDKEAPGNQQERSEEGSGEKQLDLEEVERGEQTQHDEGREEKMGQDRADTEVQQEEKMGQDRTDKDKADTEVQQEEKTGHDRTDKDKADTEMQQEVKTGQDKADTEVQQEEKIGQDRTDTEVQQEEKMDTDMEQGERRKLRSRKCRVDNENVEEASGLCDVEDNVSFISRPWRLVDGKLNRPVCKGMLESILFQIMSRPGVTRQALVEHYTNVLQPVAVFELLQALLDIGCVVKKTLVKGPKPSLFSRPVKLTRRDTDVELEDPGSVFYEPTISCCLRLSRVLPNERHWNYCI